MNCRWSLNQSNFQNLTWIVERVDYVIMCTICTFVLYRSHINMKIKKQTKNKTFSSRQMITI